MVIAAKSGVQMLLLMVAASTALLAQSSGPATPQNSASVGDARQVVVPSVLATERSWAMRDHYTYVERDDDRRLNSLGQVKSENVDVSRMILVSGARFEQLTEHNGQLPSPKEQRKSDEDLDKLTEREQEVMRLIARGYTYREVGQKLFISVKTVETHVGKVLHKLQLSNRHELAHWAARRGIS